MYTHKKILRENKAKYIVLKNIYTVKKNFVNGLSDLSSALKYLKRTFVNEPYTKHAIQFSMTINKKFIGHFAPKPLGTFGHFGFKGHMMFIPT